MRLLLDTAVALWWDDGAPLAQPALEAIAGADQVFVSAVSAWELEAKAAAGRVRSKRTLADVIRDGGFEELPLTVAHCRQLASLPRQHRDPFDRLLIAQAMAEDLVLVTRNPVASAYRVKTLWA